MQIPRLKPRAMLEKRIKKCYIKHSPRFQPWDMRSENNLLKTAKFAIPIAIGMY